MARPVDIRLTESETPPAGRCRRRVRLRFALANARMFSAALALVLLFQLGLTWPTVAAALVSFTLSALARGSSVADDDEVADGSNSKRFPEL